jgi:hypothetical protein
LRIHRLLPGLERRVAALILALSLLSGCGTSASVHSAGSENGQQNHLVLGLPF